MKKTRPPAAEVFSFFFGDLIRKKSACIYVCSFPLGKSYPIVPESVAPSEVEVDEEDSVRFRRRMFSLQNCNMHVLYVVIQ